MKFDVLMFIDRAFNKRYHSHISYEKSLFFTMKTPFGWIEVDLSEMVTHYFILNCVCKRRTCANAMSACARNSVIDFLPYGGDCSIDRERTSHGLSRLWAAEEQSRAFYTRGAGFVC